MRHALLSLTFPLSHLDNPYFTDYFNLYLLFSDTKSCKDCGVILEELERIDDDASNFGVAMVKNSEKSTAKKYGVTSFPALMYFRNQQPAIFDGE